MLQVLEDGLNEWNARDIKLDVHVHVQAQGIFFVGETQFNESSSSLIITCYTFNTHIPLIHVHVTYP